MNQHQRVLVATDGEILCIDTDGVTVARGLSGQRPTALSADRHAAGRIWCSTGAGGVFRSDGGLDWQPAGLSRERLMTVTASPARPDLVWAGAEPSRVWRSEDAGSTWRPTAELTELPSSSGWAFPPRPETHHVRWIAAHPAEADHIWVAVEAGALVRTRDGGRSWLDRVAGGPYDTHELAVHPAAPDVLRVSAGDGYYESRDGGETWSSPMEGLEVGYLRSVVIDPDDPEIVLVSASTGPRTAYVAGRADGRVYRREGRGRWRRVVNGWPDPPSTIAPLLVADDRSGELWAADERGVHRSLDAGVSWMQMQRFDPIPRHLRGIALVTSPRPGDDTP